MSTASTVAPQGIFLLATYTGPVWEPDALIAHSVTHTMFQSEHGHVVIWKGHFVFPLNQLWLQVRECQEVKSSVHNSCSLVCLCSLWFTLTHLEKNTNSCAPGLLYRCLAKYNSIPRIFRTHRKVLAWQQNHFNFLKCLLRCDEARHKMKVIYFQYVYCQIDSIFAMCNDSTTPVQYIRFISHGYHYTGNQSAQVHLCIINHLTRRHVRIKKAKQQAHSNISRFNKHTHTIPF